MKKSTRSTTQWRAGCRAAYSKQRLGPVLAASTAAALWLCTAITQAQVGYQQILGFGPSAQSGISPRGRLMEASDGFLYGTTYSGGSNYSGTVFKVGKDGTGFKVIYNFTNNDSPCGALLELSPGTLCGTTARGGTNQSGSVFRLGTDGSGFGLLLSFPLTTNSMDSEGTLVQAGGRLFGTTSGGGAGNMGTVFALNPDGSGYSVLHNFSGLSNGVDGSYPYAGLCKGRDGALYGTTQKGGSNDVGTVFKINPDTTGYEVLHHFTTGKVDGSVPIGNLVQANDGLLYGTTLSGGPYAQGAIFRISTNGLQYAVVWSLHGAVEGSQPFAGLVATSNNELYGTAQGGGTNGGGTVFRLNLDGSNFATLHSFPSDPTEDGSKPLAALFQASDGALYGSTSVYGPYYTNGAYGTLFKLVSSQPIPIRFNSISPLPGNQIQLEASGPTGHYALEVTTNLSDWAALTNFTATQANFRILNPAANAKNRVYRLHLLP